MFKCSLIYSSFLLILAILPYSSRVIFARMFLNHIVFWSDIYALGLVRQRFLRQIDIIPHCDHIHK